MTPVKWGIISTANIGLAKVIPGMLQSDRIEITAISSRDLSRAEQAANKLGIPKAYGSYEEMLADPEIEAVYNPLPNHLHVPLTEQAADAGKHVLCEKPIALTAREAERLVVARDRNNVLIQEAFMVRSHPQWLRARDLVREGRIGKLRAIQTLFSYYNTDPDNVRNMPDIGGGALYDIGCYPITTTRFIFDAEPTRVVALIERDPNFKTDRLLSAIMDFPDGQASFIVSTQLVPYQRVQICGTEGRIEIQIPFNAPPQEACLLFIDDGGKLGDASRQSETFNIVDQYQLQGELFSDAVRGERSQIVPLENSIANMKVIDAIFRSAETGGWANV